MPDQLKEKISEEISQSKEKIAQNLKLHELSEDLNNLMKTVSETSNEIATGLSSITAKAKWLENGNLYWFLKKSNHIKFFIFQNSARSRTLQMILKSLQKFQKFLIGQTVQSKKPREKFRLLKKISQKNQKTLSISHLAFLLQTYAQLWRTSWIKKLFK